jgi:hypothetical protein
MGNTGNSRALIHNGAEAISETPQDASNTKRNHATRRSTPWKGRTSGMAWKVTIDP